MKRIEWIDFVRAIAIMFVVLCHSVEEIYRLELDYFFTYKPVSRLFAFSAFTIGRLGVPFFLMITGYLLLDRDYDETRIRLFWHNHCLRLFFCTEIWFLIYDFFLKLCSNRDVDIHVIVKDMLFLHKVDMGHVWYMPMILGFYVLIPFAANAVKKVKVKLLTLPLIVYSLIAFGFPLLSIINDVYHKEPLSIQVSTGFSGGVYGIYLMIGYLIRQRFFRLFKSKLLVSTGVIAFSFAVIFQLWAYHNQFKYNIWYDSPFLLVSTVSFFELASRIDRIPCYKMFSWISYYSFPVYLTHYMFIIVLSKLFLGVSMALPLKVYFLWFFSGVLSLFVSWLINRIPGVGRLLLYLK